MELHKTPERTKSGFVLLDQNMRLVKPVNEYLDFQALRGRAENTLLAYGKDLKTFFEFLEQRKLQYDQVTANMIRDYVEYLRAPDVNTVYLFVESKRSPATINRMISTLHGFYGYHVSMYGIVNPVITEDINSPNGIFRGILYHTRKSNYTRQSVFKVKESEYRIHLFTTTEMRQMHDVLPTARDKLLFKFLLQSGARISEALSLRIEDIPVPDISSDISVLRHVKSKGRYRDIYIPTELLIDLDNYILDNRRGNCSNGDGCFFYNCPNFITEVSFLPVLRKELKLMEQEMARTKRLGYERQWQIQHSRYLHLKPLVEKLEGDTNG